MDIDQKFNFILKKYFNNNLKTLFYINRLYQQKEYAYYYEIEAFLNRGRNQVTTVLNKLERDLLITRDNHRPQKVFITSTGKELLDKIRSFF